MTILPIKIIETVLLTLTGLALAYALYITSQTVYEDEDGEEIDGGSPMTEFALFVGVLTQIVGIILIWE